VALFDATKGYPDLTQLDWLSAKMNERYEIELKKLGKHTALSKPLQNIVNLVLVRSPHLLALG
jgi:hypothetical protein